MPTGPGPPGHPGRLAQGAATIPGNGGATEADYAAGDFAAAPEEGIPVAVSAFGADGALAKAARLPFGEFPWHCHADLAMMEQFTRGWGPPRATGRPADLDPGPSAGLLTQAELAVTDVRRGPDCQALFGPAREAPAGAGPVGRLAASIGCVV